MGGVGAIAALSVAYLAYARLYATPRAALLAEWETARTSIETYQSKLEALPAVRDGLKAAAASTLGDKQDTAEHRFRTTLNSIAEGCGLREIKVDNRDPFEVRNPAGQQKLSDRACQQGYSWGYNRRANLWVNYGCRAVFVPR